MTGLRDYSFIPQERPSHEVATSHGLGNALVGSLFTASYIMRARDYEAGERPSLLSRLLGLAGGSLALYTAWLGGVLVEEYGEAVKPVIERRENQESDEGQKAHDRDRLAAGTSLGPRNG